MRPQRACPTLCITPVDMLDNLISCILGKKQPAPAASAQLPSRPSDEEIVKFEDAVRKEATAHQPPVSPALPLEVLSEDCAENDASIVARKLDTLRASKYAHLHKCRGDGNCFYRAVGFSAWLRLNMLSSDARKDLKELWDAKLKDVGFESLAYEDFSEAFWSYSLPDSATLSEFSARLAEVWMADEYTSNMALMYLRLLTSAQIRSDVPFYQAFIIDDAAVNVPRWCERNVEAVNVDADQLQVIALGNALSMDLVVVSLGSGSDPDGLQINCFKPNSPPPSFNPRFIAHLLYRPGHYDLLTCK